MTGCENDIFLVIGPSTERIARSIPNIVSNLKKDQVWLYVQNMINLTIIRQTDNTGEHFLEVSLHDVDSFWENTNDEYYAQNKGSKKQRRSLSLKYKNMTHNKDECVLSYTMYDLVSHDK